jgi:4-amino-4-deoxy-L-arabinose transferase-like glycosyltransferase
MKLPLPARRYALIAILALAAAPYVVGLGASSLWDSNEAFYAETPRRMLETGDYLNPSFNYRPRFNKPPLSYWAVVPFYKAFGVSEATERLPMAIGALVVIAAAFFLGRTLFSPEAGLLAAIALATTPRFLMFSRRIFIDIYLTMFMALTLLFFVLAETRPRRRRLYLALMYIAVGLGVLTKGPVAALLPGLTFLVYLALTRRLRAIGEMMVPVGLVIVLAIVLPYYTAVWHEHGWVYITSFLFGDNISRYTQAGWAPSRSPFFYVLALFGDLFPWSLFLVPAVWLVARTTPLWRGPVPDSTDGASAAEASCRWLPVLWVVVIVAFFSFSRSKEDTYILPVYPAVAVLAGGVMARFGGAPGVLRRLAAGAGALAGICLVALGGLILYVAFAARALELAGAVAIGAILLVGGASALASSVRARFATIAAIAIAVAAAHWVAVLVTLPDFERYKPVPDFCRIIQERAGDSAEVAYYAFASPSMVYYLRRPVVEYVTAEEAARALSSDVETYCVMRSEHLDALGPSLRAPVYVLAERVVLQGSLKHLLSRPSLPTVVLVSNRPPGGGST